MEVNWATQPHVAHWAPVAEDFGRIAKRMQLALTSGRVTGGSAPHSSSVVTREPVAASIPSAFLAATAVFFGGVAIYFAVLLVIGVALFSAVLGLMRPVLERIANAWSTWPD
jgi:hypothetical protein